MGSLPNWLSQVYGVMQAFFRFGGPTGPGINANGTALETKNSANTAFAIHRGAFPVGDNDFTTKAYVDEIARPFIVTAQSNAATSLIANSGTEHYIVVSAAGSGAAAAYVAGAVLWDDGSGTGNVTVLGPTTGQPIYVTTALTGGTFTFSANTEYIWTGSTWQSVAPSVAGVELTILIVIGTGGTYTSTTNIPANAYVTRCLTSIPTTAYAAGATVKVGQTGTLNLLQDTTDNTPTVIGNYDAPQLTSWGSSALPVIVTIGGSPASGAGLVLVEYTSPQS
jgi:hypothetical protein